MSSIMLFSTICLQTPCDKHWYHFSVGVVEQVRFKVQDSASSANKLTVGDPLQMGIVRRVNFNAH